jgi:hypothetical protein
MHPIKLHNQVSHLIFLMSGLFICTEMAGVGWKGGITHPARRLPGSLPFKGGNFGDWGAVVKLKSGHEPIA